MKIKGMPILDYNFNVRNLETLELENTILKQIIIELKSCWFASKFDHIWKEQIALHLEYKKEEEEDDC